LASDHSIGVVVGLAAEARLAQRLGWRVAIGGGTAEGAEAAAERLIGSGAGALVSFGFAGGLDPNLRAGTILVPSTVLLDGASYPADRELMHHLGGATQHRILAARCVAVSVETKRRLYRETAAAAVDLESGAVARAAMAHGMPFAVLRAICDPAEGCLPPAAIAALDARGAIGVWRVLASVAEHPTQVPALLRLAADAAVARRALIRWTQPLARALPA
jgi:adenosylhomocysteine nucleosidase